MTLIGSAAPVRTPLVLGDILRSVVRFGARVVAVTRVVMALFLLSSAFRLRRDKAKKPHRLPTLSPPFQPDPFALRGAVALPGPGGSPAPPAHLHFPVFVPECCRSPRTVSYRNGVILCCGVGS